MIPVTLLKNGVKTRILDFYQTSNTNHFVQKLYSVGFVKGREIEKINQQGKLYILRVENENPFCVNKDIAETILVDDKYMNSNNSRTFKYYFFAWLRRINGFCKDMLSKI